MGKRTADECAKKAFLLHIQSWISRATVGKSTERKPEQNEDILDTKSHMQNTRGVLIELRRCEIYPTISGFQDTKCWIEGRSSYIARGNPVCEVRFRRIVDISRMGGTWGRNEEIYHPGIMKIAEEDFHLLSRRLGRCRKMRITALNEIRTQRAEDKQPDTYVEWVEVHSRVMKMRGETGYDSAVEGGTTENEKEEKGNHESRGQKESAKGT